MEIIQEITGKYQTNVYLLYDEETKKAVMIDPGERVTEIERIIEEKALEVERILLTHGHLDHISEVDYYQEKYGAKLGAYVDEKDLLLDPALNLTRTLDKQVKLTCDEYYHDGDRIDPFDIQVVHTPGHTEGSCSYLVGENLFAGDTLFYQSAGRWDLPTGNLGHLMSSLEKLLAPENEWIVYSGHGQATDTTFERLTNPFSPYQ